MRGGSFRYPNILIASNALSGLGDQGDRQAFLVEYVPTNLLVHHNSYSPGTVFQWMATIADELDAWRALAGIDDGSVPCDPSYVALPEHDLHLHPDDTCAAGAAAMIDELLADFDGDTRPMGAPDIGADEIGR